MSKKIAIDSKKIGDEWFTLEAPEELHYWNLDYGWKKDIFQKNEISLVAVNVKSSRTIAESISNKYNHRKPLHLRKTGIDIINGYSSTNTQVQTERHLVRVDGVIELNTALEELSEMVNMSSWRVLDLEVYNKKTAAFCYFTFFNPNGVGDTLALYQVQHKDVCNGKKTYYHQIEFSVLDNLVKGFRKETISCVNMPEEPKISAQCGVLMKNELAKLRSKQNIIKK